MRGRRGSWTAALICISLGTGQAMAAPIETGWYAVSKDQGCALTHINRQRQSFVTYEEDFELGYHILEFGYEDRDARQGTGLYKIALGSRIFSEEAIGEWINYTAFVEADFVEALKSAPSIVVTDQRGKTVFEAALGSRSEALGKFNACISKF
jgi:hypothetical protein